MSTHSGHTGTTHTPGPWEAFSNSIGIGVTGAEADIAWIRHELIGLVDSRRSSAVDLANARLIAAAPLLYERAIQADQYIQHCISTENPVNVDAVPLLRLREAIAKADGREG